MSRRVNIDRAEKVKTESTRSFNDHLTVDDKRLLLKVGFPKKHFLRTFFFCFFGLACGRRQVKHKLQLIPQKLIFERCRIYVFNFRHGESSFDCFFAFCVFILLRPFTSLMTPIVARAEFFSISWISDLFARLANDGSQPAMMSQVPRWSSKDRNEKRSWE